MAPGFAAAADVSGFADIIYNIADDASLYGADGIKGNGDDTTVSATEGQFTTSGEVDVSGTPMDGVTVRMDVDLMLDQGTGNSASLEQAYAAWEATPGVTVMGGVMNNPIGMECSDAPCMWGTNAGVISTLLDGQTTRYSNNLQGLAVAGMVGPATVTLAYANDMGGVAEENSVVLVVNASPMDGLDLELGYGSQADQTKNAASVEDVVDFNVSYAIPGVDGLSVALDYLTAGKGVDSAYEIMVNYTTGPFGVGARMENVGYEATGVEDSKRTTVHGSYKVASNLTAILEVASGDDVNPNTAVTGIQADNLTTLELVATF
jgi:hypothetical protein